MAKRSRTTAIATIVFACFSVLQTAKISSAATVGASTDINAIQSKIDQRSGDIQALEKEISGYQSQIDDLNNQASTLSNTIKSLDLTQKKLQADIAVTGDKIDAANLTIVELSSKIDTAEGAIADDFRYIAESFKNMNEQGNRSPVEILLSSQSLAMADKTINGLNAFQKNLNDRISGLKDAKANLESDKLQTEKAQSNLVKLKDQLNAQRRAVLAAQTEKSQILKDTKNSETAFQKLLAEKRALKDAFEQELLRYESELKLAVDISKLPSSGTSVLSWPLDSVFITQYFGNTPFATANSQIYKGTGHNGIDLRASIGTPVKAADSGVVSGVGDTDIVRSCYSFGKWVMMKHLDGLSTLYAHLSVPVVGFGQNVSTGQVIGYSGNTGYTTGPHLHFGVYATEGLEIKQLTDSKNCRGVVVPIAALQAYLNPLSYLPPVPNQ